MQCAVHAVTQLFSTEAFKIKGQLIYQSCIW